MISLRKITYFLLMSMLLMPILALLGNSINLSREITFYYRLIFWVYGFFFVFHYISNGIRLRFPKMLYFLLLYVLYLFAWSLFNGDMARRGLLKIIINNVHMFYVLCNTGKERSDLIEYLRNKDIHTVFHYFSLHHSPFYKNKHDGRELPNSDRYQDCLLRLPLFYELKVSEIVSNTTKISSFFKSI